MLIHASSKTHRASRIAALFAFLIVALYGMQAEAGRQARGSRAKPSVKGAKVKSWKANGVRFQHETLKQNGNVIHWERRASKKGATNVSGKTWGSSYKGHQWKDKGRTLRKVNVKGTDGSKREVFSITEKNGTKRTTIKGIPGVHTRRITTWKTGNTRMTDQRDYNAKGKLTDRQRRGHKAD